MNDFLNTFSPRNKNKTHLASLIFLGLLIAANMILVSPNRSFLAKQHGWVSSHNLAIAKRSTLENGFVGYTIKYQESDKIVGLYFARTPFPTMLAMSLPLSESFSTSTQIYLVKAFLAFIWCLNLILLYYLLTQSGVNPLLSFSVVALTYSSVSFIYYRDLTSVEVFSILGFLIFCCGALHFQKHQRISAMLLFTLAATTLGWGISVIPLACIWFVLEFLSGQRTKKHFLKLSLVPGLAVLACVSFILYNCLMESIINDSRFVDSGILASASRRMGDSGHHSVQLLSHLKNELNKAFFINTPPFLRQSLDKLGPFGLFLSVGLLIAGTVMLFRRRSWPENKILFLLLVAGPAFCLPMKQLTHPHDYITILYFCSSAIFCLGILQLFKGKWALVLPVVAMLSMTHSFYIDYKVKNDSSRKRDFITEDFDRMKSFLPEDAKLSFEPDGFKKTIYANPYAPGFYLPSAVFTSAEKAEYFVTKQKDAVGLSLTPENLRFYLFKHAQSAPSQN